MSTRSPLVFALLALPLASQVDKVVPAGFGYETRAGETASSSPFGNA